MYPLLQLAVPAVPSVVPAAVGRSGIAHLTALLGQRRRGRLPPESLYRALDLLSLRCVEARRAGEAPSTPALEQHMRALAENLPLRKALRQAANALAHAQIKAIVYKGQDYAERVYGDLGGRQMADVDLLVEPQDLEAAARALGAAGFRLDRNNIREHETKFCKDGLAIDLHHALLQPARMRIIQPELFSRAVACSFAPGVYCLDPSDALLVHCINQTVKGYQLAASSYVELESLLRGADDAAVLQRATRYQAVSALYTSLRMLAELGNRRAARLQRQIRLSAARRAVLDQVVAGFARHAFGRPPPPRAALLAIKASLIDDLGDALSFIPRWCAWALPLRGPP